MSGEDDEEQVPVPISGVRLMTRHITRRGRLMSKLAERIRVLKLFDVDLRATAEERTSWIREPNGKQGGVGHQVVIERGGRSFRRWDDHPLVQAVLEHRDQYMDIKQAANRIVSQLGDLKAPDDPEQSLEFVDKLARVSGQLAKLSDSGLEHLTEMTDAVLGAMKEIGTQTVIEAKIVVEAARMEQAQLHHQDRMASVEAKGRPRLPGLSGAQRLAALRATQTEAG